LICYAQGVRWYYHRALAHCADASFGKGACRPLCNPLLICATAAQEKKRSQYVYPLATLQHMKNSGLRIRIERELRDEFLSLCRRQDRPAAQVIREFIREYISKHGGASLSDTQRLPSNDEVEQSTKGKRK